MSALHELKDKLREAITDVSLPHDGTASGRADAIWEMEKLGNAFAALFGLMVEDFARSDSQHTISVTLAACSADQILDDLRAIRHDACALEEAA